LLVRAKGELIEMPNTPLLLPSVLFTAYLFDLDGTVADSMPLHYRSWKQAVEEAGGTFPEDLFYSWGGIPLPRTVELLNEKLGYSLPVIETARRKEAIYLEIVDEVKPIAPVLDLIQAQQRQIAFAIVSGSPRASIDRTLSLLGLTRYFSVVIGAEDYTQGKPAPEPFLLAAERLGVSPRDCLVFEDADAGIASAEAAGMQWVRIPHSYFGQS
jgi:HAD superfamily hydrolase (TIGR01509 family)